MKIRNSVLALAAIASVGEARLDDAARLSILSPTDKTLWLVPDQVAVGTILITDPSGWDRKTGTFFAVDSRYLEGKLAINEGPVMSETLTVDKKVDIAAVLPFLKVLGGSFKHAKQVSITATDEHITQASDMDALRNLLLTYDKKVAGADDSARAGLFTRINAAAGQTGNRSEKARYWIVTKVYRATTTSWSDGRSTSAAVGVGCGDPPAAPDMSISLSNTSSGKTPAVAPAAGADSISTSAPGAGAKPSGSFAMNSNGAVTGAVSIPGATGVPTTSNSVTTPASVAVSASSETAAAKSKISVSAPSCTLGKFSFGSGSVSTGSNKGGILFVQMKPIFRNSSGRLYIPLPGGDDAILAPATVRRS